MKQWLVIVLVSAVLLPAAHASQDSRQLQSLGLVEFHAGRYQKALELFDKAVEADSSDVYARYYRAVTRSRLGDVSGAIGDLRLVLAAQPDLDAAALDLGVALVQTGKFQEAVPLLQQAQRNSEFDGQGSLFLGVAQLRLDEIENARENFARASARDPALKTAATYYEGVADYREGYYDTARDRFSEVASGGRTSEMGREAVAFLAKIQQRDRPNFSAAGNLAYQYDTNVALTPNDSIIQSSLCSPNGVGCGADSRFTIDVNGTYSLWRGEDAELTLGYEFFQSLHFDLTQFNLTDNGPSLQLVGTTGLFDYGIVGRYDYYLLDSSNFLQEATAYPWIGIPEDDVGRTEVFFRLRRRDFLDPTYAIRDGFNYATGFRQYFYLRSPDNFFFVGYRFDAEVPLAGSPNGCQGPPPTCDPFQYAYDGQEVSAGFGYMLPADIQGYVAYSYHREHYTKADSNGRRDEDHLPVVLVSRRMNEYLTLSGAFFGDFNNSNNPTYNYDREVGSVAVEVRY
jgi:tetratricopeptide (TPR) repeat protein